MADAFDPYHVWLGIPPEEQPADHYRLLGLRRLESSAAVIDNAADRAMGHLRSVATGKHGADAQRLLNELAAARICLLSEETRTRYDAELKTKLAAAAVAPPARAASTVSTSDRMRFTPPPVPGPPVPTTARPIPQPIPASPAPASPSTVVSAPSAWTSTYRRKSRPSFMAPLATFVGVVVFGVIGYTVWQNRTNESERVAGGGDDQESKEKPKARRGPDAPSVDRKETSSNDVPKIVPQIPSEPDKRVVEPMDLPKRSHASEAPEEPAEDPQEEPSGFVETTPPLPPATTENNPPPGDFASVAAKRAAVPSADELDARKKQIRNLFRAEFARTKPDELVATSKTLLDHARNTKDDLIGKYALLDSALDLAVDNGDVNLAKDIVLDIITFYDVDSLKLKAETLIELGRAPLVPAMKQVYIQGAWPVVRELMEGERYELVPRLTGLLLPIAQLYRDRQLVQDVKDAERDSRELREAFEPLLPLVERLAKMPDDPEARAALGKFRCFHAGDWTRGLPLLAKGGDAALAKLAAADLANPTEGKMQMEVGDAWRDVAKNAGGKRQKLEINERAAHWYGLARVKLGGLDAAKVSQSLKELTRKPRHHIDAQKFGSHWYKLFAEQVGWREAKRRCEAMGGYLVCAETKEEAAFIYRLARPKISDSAWCWMGATDEQKEGDFRWINGSPFVGAQWWSGQPDNNGGTEHYLVLALKGYNDANENHRSVFVCEWEN